MDHDNVENMKTPNCWTCHLNLQRKKEHSLWLDGTSFTLTRVIVWQFPTSDLL